jgi:hypothetical protein
MSAFEAKMHRPWIRDLPRYVPGVAPKVGEEGKLSSNESFLAPRIVCFAPFSTRLDA